VLQPKPTSMTVSKMESHTGLKSKKKISFTQKTTFMNK
jgi:hypothetical protein